MVVGHNFESDVILSLYPAEVEGDLVRRHVAKFLGEKLMSPSVEQLRIGTNGVLDPDYLLMMERAVAYWQERGDKKAVRRFAAELEGAQNLVRLVTESNKTGSVPMVMVSASDPGDFYVTIDEDGREIKKSVTFVTVLNSTKTDGWYYRQFSIPTSFIGLQEHYQILEQVADVQRTEQLLAQALQTLTPESLIAFPMVVNTVVSSIDTLAKLLGYENWEQIEQLANDQLKLENDEYARERRGAMIDFFTERILKMIRKTQRSHEDEQALVDAMGDTFALERGAVYQGWNRERIKAEIDKTIRLSMVLHGEWRDTYVSIYEHESTEPALRGRLEELIAHRAWLARQFETNPLAQEARATGCGGSGIGGLTVFGQGNFDFGITQYQLAKPGSLEVSTPYIDTASAISNNSEPEGRYKEGKYTPGVCRLCGNQREKVWKVEDGGCGCCSTCEHKPAGVVD